MSELWPPDALEIIEWAVDVFYNTPIPLFPSMGEEITLEKLSKILDTTIKKDWHNKIICLYGMILTYTEEDQINQGLNAASSTGKSYIPLEVAQYFPQEDVIDQAYTSPTAFFHEYGEWDEETRIKTIDLHQKILIFLDQPTDQLLQRIRPLLSHDKKELNIKITDRSRRGGHATKNIKLVGYPTVIFCSTKFSLDEQERTRLLMLSPETDKEKIGEALDLLLRKLADRDKFKRELEEDSGRRWLVDHVLRVKHGGIDQIIIAPEDMEYLGEQFKKRHRNKIPRLTRDLPRLIALAKAHTLMNIRNRRMEKRYYNKEDYPDPADQAFFKFKEKVAELIEEAYTPTKEKLAKETIEKLDKEMGYYTAPDFKPGDYKKYLYAERQDIETALTLYGKIGEANERGLPPVVWELYTKLIQPQTDGITRKQLAILYYDEYKRPLGARKMKATLELLAATGLIGEEPHPDDRRIKIIYNTRGVTTHIIDANSKSPSKKQEKLDTSMLVTPPVLYIEELEE